MYFIELPIADGVNGIKRKSTDIIDTSSTTKKSLSLLSNDAYSQKGDILFSKTDNFIKHRLHHWQSNSSSMMELKKRFVPFDHSVRIGQFIYVPMPVMSSQSDIFDQNNKPLDLSKSKNINDEYEKSITLSNLPLDLSIEKAPKFNQQQFYECQYCSICFRSVESLHAHQDNYCIGYRDQRKDHNDHLLSDIFESHR